MGEAPGFGAMGQVPEVVAVGYARASPGLASSPGLAQVARMAHCLPWYQHCQPMYLPSVPGQSSDVVCHHPHPYPPPHLSSLHLPPLHLPPNHCHHSFPYPHRCRNQCRPLRPHHPPCAYPHQGQVLSHTCRPTSL